MASIDPQPFIDEFVSSPAEALMKNRGYYLFDRKVDTAACRDLCVRIDRLSESGKAEIHYGGSEHRNWHAAARDAAFAPIEAISNAVMPRLYGRESKAFNVLAIRNRRVPPEAERTDMRWHLDSFRKQLKLFLFLTDVTEDTGPLEYVPYTHKPAFKYRNALRLGYYRLKDLKPENRGKRSWRRIHDNTIVRVEELGYPAQPLVVPAGTFALVDTSGLHRARPCFSGERYAVTTYHH